jgi:hypothetical protein
LGYGLFSIVNSEAEVPEGPAGNLASFSRDMTSLTGSDSSFDVASSLYAEVHHILPILRRQDRNDASRCLLFDVRL